MSDEKITVALTKREWMAVANTLSAEETRVRHLAEGDRNEFMRGTMQSGRSVLSHARQVIFVTLRQHERGS